MRRAGGIRTAPGRHPGGHHPLGHLRHPAALDDKTEIGRFRCLQLDCDTEVLTSGPVYDNVWWHNTLFHGKAEESTVIHFHHRRTLDTRFGGLEELG